MEYWMKSEVLHVDLRVSKAVAVFEANSLPDALRKVADMMEHPSVVKKPLQVGQEERITVGLNPPAV